MILFQNGKSFQEYKYKREDEFEKDIVDSYKLFFGQDSVYIDAKKKIGSEIIGKTIPDGFLFDMSDPENREFYLVEVELASHDFYRHIFPQITKFFAFYRNSKRQKELVEKLFSTINNDQKLKNEFKKYLGKQEIFKFLNDVIDSSQNILLIIDGDKRELPEIMDTYSDTWGKMVKILNVKKYIHRNDNIFTVDPEFETIEYAYQELPSEEEETPSVAYSEEFHLEGVTDNVKEIYANIKQEVLKIDNTYIFNPQKYYISIRKLRNIVFMQIRKKKIRLVIMLPEDEIRARISEHSVRALSDPVQTFYNGPCAAVDLHNLDNIDEVIDLIRTLIEQDISKEPEDSSTLD
jgi:predicted transport protein